MTLRILVTNDDGINASGLEVAESIAKKLATKKGRVVTVAPAVDQSGVGHSISYLRPSLILKHSDDRYSVEGSPADCVLAGIYHVMQDYRPDLIISGVNNGHNIAEDIVYSGTVGAAMEGALQGIKSIAISQCYSKDSLSFEDPFESSRELGANICSKLLSLNDFGSKPYGTFYNLNFPATRSVDITGVKACRQGRRQIGSFSMDPTLAPNGRTFLMVNHKPSKSENVTVNSFETDIEKNQNNYVTVTPLKADLTEFAKLETLTKIFENDF